MPDYGLNQYQQDAAVTAVFDHDQALAYLALGLVGEAGEVANKVKKVLRGDYDQDALREILAGELGDVLWYLAILAKELELDLAEIGEQNIAKLADRLARGKIKGNGDNR
jgi:NTP pyrophosphatase (non-canonical NTP hydrolase)